MVYPLDALHAVTSVDGLPASMRSTARPQDCLYAARIVLARHCRLRNNRCVFQYPYCHRLRSFCLLGGSCLSIADRTVALEVVSYGGMLVFLGQQAAAAGLAKHGWKLTPLLANVPARKKSCDAREFPCELVFPALHNRSGTDARERSGARPGRPPYPGTLLCDTLLATPWRRARNAAWPPRRTNRSTNADKTDIEPMRTY